MERNHFIIVGRTSDAIADGILRDFGQGPGLRVDRPGNVFQSRFGTFGDGESIFELFVEGKLPDHPIAQQLSEPEKTHDRAESSGRARHHRSFHQRREHQQPGEQPARWYLRPETQLPCGQHHTGKPTLAFHA
jgi:hypothetical protein